MRNSSLILLFGLVLFLILLFGCTEQEEKEFGDAIINATITGASGEAQRGINNLNQLGCKERFECSGADAVKIYCVGGKEVRSIVYVGQYCDSSNVYHIVSCENGIKKDDRFLSISNCASIREIKKTYCSGGKVKEETSSCSIGVCTTSGDHRVACSVG